MTEFKARILIRSQVRKLFREAVKLTLDFKHWKKDEEEIEDELRKCLQDMICEYYGDILEKEKIK